MNIFILLLSSKRGRATYDASQEIRNKHLTREDAKLLVKKYDGESLKDIFQK